jgi:hypothetical protein
MSVCPASAQGNPRHGRSVPQYARAGQTSWAILPPKQMRPPYDAHGPPMGDAPPFVRADRRGVLQRNGTPKNSLKLRDQHRQREPRKAPVPLCDGMVRRCENCGDTGGSVEAFVEAWPILRQANGVKSLIVRDWYRWWDSNPHGDSPLFIKHSNRVIRQRETPLYKGRLSRYLSRCGASHQTTRFRTVVGQFYWG